MIEGYKMIKEAAGQRNIRPRTLQASGILGCGRCRKCVCKTKSPVP